MQNYNRTVKSHLWSTRVFHSLTACEKAVYLYMLTGPVTSDTSVYLMPLDQAALDIGLSAEEITKILRHFEKLQLIVYDWVQEEVCVLDYFTYGTSPIGGLNYEMYSKDFDKINNKELIGHAKESAKKADIAMPFFAALQDYYPEIQEDDYMLRATTKTADEMRSAAKRGRRNSSASRKKPDFEDEVTVTEDGEILPF